MSSLPPRPEYGEYASPEDAEAARVARLPAHERYPAPLPEHRVVEPGPTPANPRRWDRILSIALVGFGAYSTIQIVFTMLNFEAFMASLYESYAITETFETLPGQGATVTFIIVSQLLLFALAVVLTTRRLRTGRLTFWVPLVVGVAANLVYAIAFTALLLGDQNFVAMVQEMTGR